LSLYLKHLISSIAFAVLYAMPMPANSVFQQILGGASVLELLEGPFQHLLSGIAELSVLTGGKLFRLGS